MAKKNESTPDDISIFSSGIKIEGDLNSDGNVRVDGKVIGNITVKGNLTVGDSAELNGNISATNITVSGKIEGEIKSSGKLVLKSKAVVCGDIVSKILVIEEGVKFDGNSNMISNDITKSNTLEEFRASKRAVS